MSEIIEAWAKCHGWSQYKNWGAWEYKNDTKWVYSNSYVIGEFAKYMMNL